MVEAAYKLFTLRRKQYTIFIFALELVIVN